MAYKDLQEFIRVLKEKDELIVIDTEVNTELEITEITDRVSKNYGKALLFTNIKDKKYPVLINAMGTYERMSLALGTKNFKEIEERIGEFIKIANFDGILNKAKHIPKVATLINVLPIKVPRGKCQEVINHNPNLLELPVLKCWPEDGGNFITLPIVITKDPISGVQNMGMYRMQVYDETSTGMHWHMHKDGKETYKNHKKLKINKMPVSVALGCDPAITYSATAPLPAFIDEVMFAGFLRKRSVSMVKSVTSNIYVPSSAEFVLEGYVDVTEELKTEGPFGDHTGYYSIADKYPIFHVTCITHRKKPVYPTTIVGKPPMEDCYMGKATEKIFLPLMKMQYPEIINISFPLEGVFHNCIIVSIKKSYPLHGKKIMNSIWGLGQMMYTKMVVVVDHTIDASNYNEVIWEIYNNVKENRDLVLSEGPLDTLDHASNFAHFGTRLGIDATEKWDSEGYDTSNNSSIIFPIRELRNIDTNIAINAVATFKNTHKEISEIEFPFESMFHNCIVISIKKNAPLQGKNIIDDIWKDDILKNTKIIIIVDDIISAKNYSEVIWKLFNNIDVGRDLFFNNSNDVLGVRVGIDATKKRNDEGYKRKWPNDIVMSNKIIDLVTKKWVSYGIS